MYSWCIWGLKGKKQVFIDAFTGEKMQQYDRNYILEEKMKRQRLEEIFSTLDATNFYD